MKQFIRPILIVFLFGLYPFPAFAQESYTIDSVTVTATRVPVALHSSARIVTLMDSVAIATSPAETVNDLLKYALGVDVRQRGAMGMQTDISIRGGTYNQVAVLLDGINITDPQTGHNSFDFPVNLGDIERIEVLEGPAARVYGTSSLLGAINIVTKKKADDVVTAVLEGGSFLSLGANASAAIRHRGGFNSISAGYQRSDGFSRSAAFDNQFEHTLKTFAAVKSEGKGPLHFTPALYWNHGEDRFELFRNAPEKYPFNYHKTNVAGANLNFRFDSRLGHTAFGAEARHEAIRISGIDSRLQYRQQRRHQTVPRLRCQPPDYRWCAAVRLVQHLLSYANFYGTVLFGGRPPG